MIPNPTWFLPKSSGSEAVRPETPAGPTHGQLGSPPACRLPAITFQLTSGVQSAYPVLKQDACKAPGIRAL